MRMQRFVLSFLVVCAVAAPASAAPRSVVMPTTDDAGSAHVNVAAAGTSFSIDNQPNGGPPHTLTVTAIPESGSNCGDFSASPTSFAAIEDMDPPSTVNVSFTPSGRGARSCTYTLTDNDGDSTNETFDATGTGLCPDQTVSTGTLNFGSVHVGDPDMLTFTVTNTLTGNENLTFSAMVTSGATDYFLTLPGDLTLAPGETSAAITVQFVPTARGSRPGTIQVTGNDALGGTDFITLSGTGTAPVLNVNPTTTLNCGSAAVAGGTQTCDLTITNNSSDTGEVLTWSGSVTAGGTDYSITTMGDTTLNPLQSTTMTITFNPTTSGTRAGTVSFTSDDPAATGSDTVALTGIGTVAIIGLTPSPVAFGSVHVNTNGNQTLTIDNLAVSPNAHNLVVTSMAMATGQPSEFAFTDHGCTGQSCTPGTPITVTPGTDTEDVVLRCRPTSRGAKTTVLTATGNQDSGTGTVTLNCTGTEPEINLTASALAFGNEIVGGTNPQLTFSIQNTFTGVGEETLDYTITKAGAGQAAYTVSPPCTSNCTIAPGATQVITVTFNPSSRTSFPATLTIASDDIDEPSLVVTLSGTGIAPVIGNAMPVGQTIAFGGIAVGATSTGQVASIQNVGDSPLNITSVALVGAQANQFAITTGTTGPHVVAATASDAWTVVCSPTSIGAKTATLRITSDALGASTFDFTLTCTGEQAVFTITPPGGLNFGGVPVGMADTLPVTINNIGNITGTISTIVSGNAVYTFNVVGGAPPRTVAAGGTLTVDVTFTPLNGNVINSQLTVTAIGNPTSFTIPLTGDGQTQGVDITVEDEPDLSVDLGEIRINNTLPKLVTVQNTGDTPYTLQPPGSNDSECGIQLVSPATWPAVVPGGGFATFRVNATPDMLGARSCIVTVTSSIPTTDTITFSFVGVAPGIDLINPANGVLDYAGVDIDTSGGATQTITIENTGDFVLTVSACSITGSTAFTLATPCTGGVQVDEGTQGTLDVVFDPTMESAESAQLTIIHDGYMIPPIVIELDGVGIDQHINLPATQYDFPPTFRNPDDDDVPVEMIVVENPLHPVTGAASEMRISMAVTEANFADVFVVTNEGPYDVTPGGQVEIPVEFRPTAAGTTFEATITIFNNTTALPMAQVTVTGEGISRAVMVTPGSYDFGMVGVGIPVRLSDLSANGVVVNNIDTTGEEYVIRELQFVDGDGNIIEDENWRIIGAGDPRTLAANGTELFDVELVALEADPDITITLAVYLDGDPEAHHVMTLTGAAVDVEVRGGGGCQAGGGGRGTLALVVLALGLVLARRRRGAALLALLAIGTFAGPARAEPTRNVELQTFAPAPATEVEGFAIESATVGLEGAWALGVSVSYATNVLMVVPASGDAMADTPVSARTAFQLGFAYAFLGQFEAGLRLPFYQQAGESAPMFGLQPAEGGALGDAAAHLKARLLASGSIALAASIDITVPTATDDQFAGVDGPSGHVRAIAGWKSPRIGVTGNAGFVARQPGDLGDISQGNAITFGAGTTYRAMKNLWVVGEAFGSSGMGSEGGGVMQLEGVLGVRYEIGRSVGISVGGGRGILTGIGSPDVRGFFLLDVSPRAREAGPLFVEKPKAPRDTRDDDGDAVVNADDECFDEPEDADGYHDDDGCPEPDNDEDKILDGADKCPLEAEDLDGFTDDDGCADKDDDNDKIADVDDKCPREAEDYDGHMDNDGCDEPDNDTDGIPDVIDQCQLEPETINGNNDDDGCPDSGDSLVMVMPDRIEIFEPVTFDGTGAKLSRKSANVLGQVAATMRANREFKRIRVTVHVHPRGSGDKDLSEKRAKAVREWLVQWGIEPERVEARGLGSTRPLVPKKQKGAAALNDRVEFIILEKDVK